MRVSVIRFFILSSLLFSMLAATFTAVANPVMNSGWWWNPAEAGRGFTIEQQGNNIFMAGFLYDVAGRATWYAAGPTAINGSTFNSTLTEYSGGQSLTGTFRAPTSTRNIGDISITFSDPNHGTLTWPGGTIPIQRYDFGPGGSGATPPPGTPQTGWWWNAEEGGRGYSIEVQGNTMFLGGYMYDVFGNPIWYASGPMAMTNTTTYRGAWNEYGNGQTLAGLFQLAQVVNPNVGAVTIQFSSTTTATMTLSGGRQIPLSKFPFAAPITGGAPGGLFVGYYQEDPIDNPEDPTVGGLYLNLPSSDGAFSGNMYFTYFGCQSENVGRASGVKTDQSLSGNWSGTIDGSPQSGAFNVTYGAAGAFYTGTYTNSGGKQFRDLSPCIRYTIASKGTWEMFAVGQNVPGTFQVNVVGTRASWTRPTGASFTHVSFLDADVAATSSGGNAFKQQLFTSGSSVDLPTSSLISGRQYIVSVTITGVNRQLIAFGSKQFVAP